MSGSVDDLGSWIAAMGERARLERPAREEIDALADLAAQHETIGTDLGDGARFRLAKSAVVRVGRLHSSHQVIVNQALVQAVKALAAQVEALHDTVRHQADHQRAADAAIAAGAAATADLEARLGIVETELKRVRARLQRPPAAAPAGAGGAEATAAGAGDRVDDDLYEAFEAAFRGSRETIIERSRPHAEVLAEAASITGAPVIDLGFGRAELLEALRDAGADAYGVDTNERFVEDARDAGFDARIGDALGHLRSLDDGSAGGVVALHLVEHLPLAGVVDLVVEANRVLRPGGLLLLETPNCTTWRVGADTFYLDPTHQRPVHPLFLRFLVEHAGFRPVEIRPLHESAEDRLDPPADGADAPLAELVEAWNRVYAGPLDYAVLGWRPPPLE